MRTIVRSQVSLSHAVLVVAGAALLLSGCSRASKNVSGPAVPTSAAIGDTTVPARLVDCPPTSPSAQSATVDFVDAIEANGTQYMVGTPYNGPPATSIAETDLGPIQFRVRCSLSQLNAATHRETPNPRDGDSSFLAPGTPVYAIKGWSPLCRLAASHGGATWQVYFALEKTASVATFKTCATHQ